ncbi:MAG: hypothetical protein ABI920_16030 [Casimicrobiaceae bacterium]
MPIPPKPGRFLDQLRKQSESVRETEGEPQRPMEDVLRAMDGQLWAGFRWLEEALRHLEVIRPRVQHAFTLLGVLTITAPRYERGFVSYRRRPVAGMDLLEHLELFYRLVGDGPVTVKVQPGSAGGIEERLRSAHLQYRYETELDEYRTVRSGTFTVTPEISASVRIEPDYRRQRFDVTLRNIDRFESVMLDFAGDGLSEPALEDLVHFILGEHNHFLRRAPLAGMGARRQDAALARTARTLSSRSAA